MPSSEESIEPGSYSRRASGMSKAYEVLAEALESERQRLHQADIEAVARGKKNFSGLAAHTKAATFVWTAALLEVFLPSFLEEVFEEITALNLPGYQLRPSLFAAICESQFHTIRSADPASAWSSRLAVLSLMDSHDAMEIRSSGPLDGKTVRGYHFELIWGTIGLQGSPWPTILHRNVIEDLATSRNSVAHGNISPVAFGRGRTFGDCQKMLDRVDEVAMNLVVATDDYVKDAQYLR